MKLGIDLDPRWARALPVGVFLVLAACVSEPHLSPPLGAPPDLRGTWTGTWAGTPLTLVVLDQTGTEPTGGVTLGPWSLTGSALPALSGVLTFESAGAPVSINVQGRFGDWHDRLTLVLDGVTPNGEQIVLTELTSTRLRGSGRSIPSWQPQGLVDLRR